MKIVLSLQRFMGKSALSINYVQMNPWCRYSKDDSRRKER